MPLKCAQCKSHLLEKSKFCNTCGASQSSPLMQLSNNCSSCGVSVQNMKFCPSCGTPCTERQPEGLNSTRKLDMSGFESNLCLQRSQNEMQYQQARDLATAKRAAAEAKFARLEQEMDTRPKYQKHKPSTRAAIPTASTSSIAPSSLASCVSCATPVGNMKFCPTCGTPTAIAPKKSPFTSMAQHVSENYNSAVSVQAICAQCNVVSAELHPKFCAACGSSFGGSKLNKQPLRVAEDTLKQGCAAQICKKCSADTTNMKFCPSCGTPTGLRTTTSCPSTQFSEIPPDVAAYASSAASKYISAASRSAPSTSTAPMFAPTALTSSASSVASKYLSATSRSVPSTTSTEMVASEAPRAIALASSVATSLPRPTPSGHRSNSAAPPSFIPPTFIPPQEGTGHVYTMTQTVTRSVTYNA